MLRRRRDDEGAALIAVVVLGFVMMVLIATGLTVATSGLRQAVGVQRSTSALDAAYAGVQDYLARVNLDKQYIQYGNPDDPFNTGKALTRPDTWNPAFGMGEKTGDPAKDRYTTWATVPGSAKNPTTDAAEQTAYYRYEVDKSQYLSSGVIRLRVTGLSGTRTRTILASFRVKGFVDYGYFTDFEIKDPETFAIPSGAKSFDPNSCVVYAWTGKRPSACSYINADNPTKTTDMRQPFKSTDLLYGDVHTNDTPTFKTSQVSACGMVVTGQFETGAPTSDQAFKDAASCSPKIPLVNKATLAMPATNTAMKADAACIYTGPTQVTYHADGTMTVVSPWTKSTGVGGAAKCGAVSALTSAGGARVPQLDQNLLYVQNVPTVANDPINGWASTAKPGSVTCIGADGALDPSAVTGVGWSIGTGANQIRYPLAGESPATTWANTSKPTQWNTTTAAYGCRNGDLYVSGRVTSLTTAASENYVWITGDIVYSDRTADLLGLVGQSSVVVWNPMSASGDQPMVKPGDTGIQVNLEVDAAIVSVAHTFRVQNHDRGSTRGSLEVFGSIAQKFRGSVAAAHQEQQVDPSDSSKTVTVTVYTGYTKAYQYDTVLKTVSPPYFLEPSATSFQITRYATVPTAFTPSGATATP